ncbi:hypothetical protein HK103_002952 [Boothiomyces macroporosus]|uniref:Alpha-glucosidase n=1 Tax=Boothiomyces macroporosus TaxID=261099 RepID=A0AAD5UIF3_9FUNG|nr:hypothetical protein HK103_002952 [Boothiomyces macroporosus]
MKLRNPSGFKLKSSKPIVLVNDHGNEFRIEIISDSVIRIVHIQPGVQLEESQSLDLPSVQAKVFENQDHLLIDTAQIRIKVYYKQDLYLEWCTLDEIQFLADLKFRAYEYDLHAGAGHHLKHSPDLIYYGLGERGSPLFLNERSFQLKCTDALGYNPESGDPLYKHIPFYIGLNQSTKIAYGIFYNSLSTGYMNFGSEIDALWGQFTNVKFDTGPLDYYVIFGPQISAVVEGFASIIGKPALVPKYALGYLASSMGYAESEEAQQLIDNFPSLLSKHGISCDLLHLSSGYTVDEVTGTRNVFTWNNIIRLWSAGEGATAEGSYIDFSNPIGKQFWKDGIKELLEIGIEGIWNDNNEMSIHDDDHLFDMGASPKAVGQVGRAYQTILMAEASYEAMIETNPTKRPFLITRSGAPRSHVYASQTWSGDNSTSWNTLKHNIPMGLNAGLSLLSGYGHDVGGFVGPRPSPELFVRWVQSGIFHPRFCIHSWKKEGITEPWMYPQVLPIIRDAITFRYKLIPYLYSLSVESHKTGLPIIRPTVMHFQNDPNTFKQSFDYLLGPRLLVGSVYEEGATFRSIYLPNSDDALWYDFWGGRWYNGGQRVKVPVPLDQHGCLFAKSGSIIPINPSPGQNTTFDSSRTILIFPSFADGSSETVIFDDDGMSLAAPQFTVKMKMVWTSDKVTVEFNVIKKDWRPAYSEIKFQLPIADHRDLILNGIKCNSIQI